MNIVGYISYSHKPSWYQNKDEKMKNFLKMKNNPLLSDLERRKNDVKIKAR